MMPVDQPEVWPRGVEWKNNGTSWTPAIALVALSAGYIKPKWTRHDGLNWPYTRAKRGKLRLWQVTIRWPRGVRGHLARAAFRDVGWAGS